MTVGHEVLSKIWERRIQGIEQKIAALKLIGIPEDDPEIKKLYSKLEFFRKCKVSSLIISCDDL